LKKRKKSIISLGDNAQIFYFANSGPKMVRQPFEFNNYPVFQTSVIIFKHVKC